MAISREHKNMLSGLSNDMFISKLKKELIELADKLNDKSTTEELRECAIKLMELAKEIQRIQKVNE